MFIFLHTCSFFLSPSLLNKKERRERKEEKIRERKWEGKRERKKAAAKNMFNLIYVRILLKSYVCAQNKENFCNFSIFKFLCQNKVSHKNTLFYIFVLFFDHTLKSE